MLRNPWGHSEWTGAWSDGSKEWTAEWLTLLDHRFGDDGAWWMSCKNLPQLQVNLFLQLIMNHDMGR